MLRRVRSRKYRRIAAVLVGLVILFAVFAWLLPSMKGQGAVSLVKRFYELEQKGNFGEAWELLHPQMQAKFNKDIYIQRRAHVFMQDLGVNTFEFVIGHAKRVTGWRMSKDSPLFPEAYEVPVTQHFHSIFGEMSVHQEIYVVNDHDKWRILWRYEH